MILCPATEDVGLFARSLVETLRDQGGGAVAHELLVAIDNDVESGQPLKTLAVHDGRLYYGLRSLGTLP